MQGNVYSELMIQTDLKSLVNEIIFAHELFLVYFVNCICYLYMFRTCQGPLSEGTTVFMRHLIFVILFSWQFDVPSCTPDNQLNRITRTKCFRFQIFAMFCMLYVFFWVLPRRLNFICRRFGTPCLFHLRRQVEVEYYTYLPMKKQSVSKRRHIIFRRRGITQKEILKCRILQLPAYEDGSECSETSAYKIQTPGNYPEGNIKKEVSYKYSYSCRWWTWRGPKHVEFMKKIGEIH